MLKQYILMRGDLLDIMPIGKAIGQGSHAAVAASGQSTPEDIELWKTNGEAKIVLKAKSLTQVENTIAKLKEAGILHAVIVDEGRTVFNGEKTLTCIGVGPVDNPAVNQIMKKFQLLT
jgi:peptidyl-tRNA hydrolase